MVKLKKFGFDVDPVGVDVMESFTVTIKNMTNVVEWSCLKHY